MKQTRNRRKAPAPHALGLVTLDQWQASKTDREWALTDPQFRRVSTVLTIERIRALDHAPLPPGSILTEQARYGIQMGYEAALRVVEKMALPSDPPPPEPLDQEFPDQLNGLHELATTD